MLSLGSLTFISPWILSGLLALPILWWLLRAIPPSPKTQVFAGVRLLLGLEDERRQTDKTPWWLLLLRCLAIAAALIGLAQPVMNLLQRGAGGSGTLLLMMDQSWASAPEWSERTSTARAILEEAAETNRDVVFWPLSEPDMPPKMSAAAAIPLLSSLEPRAWEPDHARALAALQSDTLGVSQTIWLHDGLSREGTENLAALLDDLGAFRLIGPETPVFALTPPRLEDGALRADVIGAVPPDGVQAVAFTKAEEGGERLIAVATSDAADGNRAGLTFDLPSELYGSVTRISLIDRPSAGGSSLADGSISRVEAALVAPTADESVTTLTSPTHYLEKALVPWANYDRLDLGEAIADDPAAILLSDYGDFSDADREALTEWVAKGGLLIRFAGPRLAASIGARGFGQARDDDPLLPVKLRRGGRVLGGALAWSTPRALGPFEEASPFRGLTPPDEVDVRTQVLAEPVPDLRQRVWASLDDGTPLVTSSTLESGRVVLFHISSDAEWSSLPLSGLFVEMLGRVLALAPGRSADLPDPEMLAGTFWRPDLLMGAQGVPEPPSPLAETVAGERLLATTGPDLPPGIYERTDAARGDATGVGSIVVNLTSQETTLSAFPEPPAGAITETLGGDAPERYGPWLLALAVLLIMADILGTLIVSGRLSRPVQGGALVMLLGVLAAPDLPRADEVPPAAISATAETTIGFVRTGDNRIDRVSERALIGLGMALTDRTAIEPGPPMGVRPGEDELGFFPVLYWPLTLASVPDGPALEALADYLRGGGLLIIDTQNGSSGFGGASAVQMREIARALSLPPLAPVDDDHVLSRTFYLLTQFPGRWRGGRVWAEAAPPTSGEGASAQDIPQFDRIDDNVSPVIVGSADWASAWAVDDRGLPMFPVGRPGDRQRELAFRFGVNAVMYALTGNYKSDQVHAPAVLQRLGQ